MLHQPIGVHHFYHVDTFVAVLDSKKKQTKEQLFKQYYHVFRFPRTVHNSEVLDIKRLFLP
ncbi:MAG: hypothetical protein Q4A10_08275 [Aerococcaceae bacterium]|nr:hypothetical protein [Aerococcaceae bacterium]